MSQIDTLLSQMQSSGAARAILRGDAPLQLQLSSGAVTQGATISATHIEEMLREILPADAQIALESSGVAQFDYASPLGVCRVQAKRNDGVTSLALAPNFAVAPQNVVAPNVISQNIAPQNVPQSVAPQSFLPQAAPLIAPNDSGQKDAILPAELRGFNWGGLLLSWVWAIGNKSWIGLLGLIPILGFFVRFFLGFKGNQMAWRSRNWQSVEQFRATQKTWTVAGICIVLIGSLLFIPIMSAIMFPVFARARENARRSSCQTNMKQISLGVMQYTSANKGRFPSGTTMESWKIALKPYLLVDTMWVCPSAKPGEESYLLNPNMAGVDTETLENAAQTPLFFDGDSRHLDGVNVVFADGHVKWYSDENFESQILPQIEQ